MGAHELVCCRLHDRLVQVLGIEPGSIHIKRILEPGIVNLIGVLLPGTGADGIEVLMDLKGLRHHDVTGKMGIEGVGQSLRRDGGAGTEVRHIATGVYSGISTPAAGHMDRVAHHHGSGFFQGFCHRGQILLNLPAVVVGAEIG